MKVTQISEASREESEFSCHDSHSVSQWRDGASISAIDQVATEVPVALVYNGISHVVMLMSPSNLEEFALGFSLSEQILHSRKELYDLEVVQRDDGIELQMTIAQERFNALKQRRRNLAGRTGCGLCGTESLKQVRHKFARVDGNMTVTHTALHEALERLPAMQSLQAITGATHAAAWAKSDGSLVFVQEDIGRHNALDKLIGKLAKHDQDFADGFAIVTSRASYEMVQKTASVGIPLLLAVSAPTSMAVQLAQNTGITLAGFARNGKHVVYANIQRLID